MTSDRDGRHPPLESYRTDLLRLARERASSDEEAAHAVSNTIRGAEQWVEKIVPGKTWSYLVAVMSRMLVDERRLRLARARQEMRVEFVLAEGERRRPVSPRAVRLIAARLPATHRRRYLREWRTDLAYLDNPVRRLLFVLGLVAGVLPLRRALRGYQAEHPDCDPYGPR